MADIVAINTSIWADEWVAELDNPEYRVWSYLLTNQKRTIAGVYQLTKRQIEAEIPFLLGSEIEAALARFQIEDKIFFSGNWVVMRNHFKNQKLKGSQHWRGVANVINSAPDWLRERLLNENDPLFIDFYRVSEGYLDRVSRYGINTLGIVPEKGSEVKGSETSPSLHSGEVTNGARPKGRAIAKETVPPNRKPRPEDEDPLAKWDAQL